MLHFSLPLRPRTTVRSEYLITPISIGFEKDGLKILCLTDIKDKGESKAELEQYRTILSDKLPPFDQTLVDSDQDFLSFAIPTLIQRLNLEVEEAEVKMCICGAYEELARVRMFDLRRVKNGRCSYCQSELKETKRRVLFAHVTWPDPETLTFNKHWVRTDLQQFFARQIATYKISKENEPIRIPFQGNEFGIRYQFLWATIDLFQKSPFLIK